MKKKLLTPLVSIFLLTIVMGCATSKPVALMSPLIDAAIRGKTDTVALLLKQGADIEEKTSLQQTPLLLAALTGQTSTIEVLLNNGAALEARDQLGRTPLMYSLLGGNPKTVQALLDRGADINAKDNYEGTPYFIASQTINFFQTRALLENNKHLSIRTFDLSTEEFQKKWTEKLNEIAPDSEFTWEKPSPPHKRPFYRAKAGDLMALMMGEYQNKAYWASVSPVLTRAAPYLLFLFHVDTLIALTNPGISLEEKEKIISDLKLTDKNPDFSQRMDFVMVNGIVYLIEINMRKGTPLYFCAFPRQYK